MIQFLLGFAVVLLPERFRRKWLPQWHGNLRGSAVVSGIAQMLLTVGLLIYRYPIFVGGEVTQI